MGIKCSLFGHAFGEAAVEREREEQGSEVVITIREVETCERCGDTRVVSENKEVTTVETPDDVAMGDTDASDTAPDEDATQAGPEIVDAEAGEPVGTGEGESEESTVEPPTSAAEDDGVILEDDETDQPGREPGEWPEEDEDDSAADSPVDLTPPEEEMSVTAEQGTPDDQEEPEDSAVWSETDPDLDGERSSSGTVTVPDGQFRCGECGFTTPVESSSLREGDYCPECHRGTLVHEAE
jgi:ribosomal protein S27AE